MGSTARLRRWTGRAALAAALAGALAAPVVLPAGPAGAAGADVARPLESLSVESCTAAALAPGDPACHRVARGEWLWGIARAGDPAIEGWGCQLDDPVAVSRRAAALYERNRGVIGPDPDRLRPGTLLVVGVFRGFATSCFPPSQRVLDEDDNGRTVRLQPNSGVDVRLVACPGCGFEWRVIRAPHPGVLSPPVRVADEPLAPGSVPGAQVRQVFSTSATGFGSTYLALGYFGPGQTRPTEVFTLHVRSSD